MVTEFLIKGAPPEETVLGLAVRLLNINFGSIHTSFVSLVLTGDHKLMKFIRSIFITQALFEFALLPPEDIESIRTEIQEALEAEGGWTKGALLKFRKVDSALREVGRFYGLMYCTFCVSLPRPEFDSLPVALGRVALVGCDLGDGTSVPPGFRVAIDMKAIHFNADVYPNPEVCDLFRFSKLRETESSDSKHGFATVDAHVSALYLVYGESSYLEPVPAFRCRSTCMCWTFLRSGMLAFFWNHAHHLIHTQDGVKNNGGSHPIEI